MGLIGNVLGGTGGTGDVGGTGDYGAGGTGGTGGTGADGAAWLMGAGAPDNGNGVSGDYYLNSTNGDVYLKVGASWT